MNILDEYNDEKMIEPEQSQTTQQSVKKGPFIGFIIALLGAILLISCIFIKSNVSAQVTGQVSYASKQKISGETRYQDLKIKYTYGGREYETAIEVAGGKYSKYDEVTVRILNDNPTNISVSKVSSGKGGIIFCGILFIGIGALLFLNIISYDDIEFKIKNSIARLMNPSNNTEKSQGNGILSSGMMSGVSDLLDKLPKKDRDNTKDDMEERIARRKAKEEPKKKNNSVYVSDNILDLYMDDDEEDDK